MSNGNHGGSRYIATIQVLAQAFLWVLIWMFALIILSCILWFGVRVFHLLMAAIEHLFNFGEVVVWAIALVLVTLLSSLFLGILTIFFRDLFWNFLEQRRELREMKKAIASSSIPSLELLVSVRHIDDIHSVNPISYKAASLLSALYRKRLGFFPSMDRAVELEQFKSRHLPRLIIKNKHLFESEFGKLYACFLSEHQFPGLKHWTYQCLVSSIRIRESFAGIRHLLYIVTSLFTFGKYPFGLSAEDMFQTIDPENHVISPPLFVRLCMLNYWVSQPDLTVFSAPERDSILDESPVLLLPASTQSEEPEIIEVMEAEVIESEAQSNEDLHHAEEKITPEVAITSAQWMLDLLRKDSPLWADPELFFEKALKTLNQVLPYLPDDGLGKQRESVYVLIGQIQAAQGMIGDFDEAYLETHSIDPEMTPKWFAEANLECGIGNTDPNLIRRLCCRHFFAERFDWQEIRETEVVKEEPSLFELGGLV